MASLLLLQVSVNFLWRPDAFCNFAVHNTRRIHSNFVSSVLLCLYIPVAITGFVAYGTDVNANILQSLPDGWIRITVDILIMTHLFFAIIIVFNPVAQHLEDTLNIEHGTFE